MTSFSRWSFRIYFMLAALEAAAAVLALLRIPSDSAGALLLGFSAARLALLAAALLLALAFGALSLRAFRRPDWLERLHDTLKKSAVRRDFPLAGALLGLGLAFAGAFYLNAMASGLFSTWQAVLERLLPLVLWAAAFGLQTALLVVLLFSHSPQVGWRVSPAALLLGVGGVALFPLIMTFSGWGTRRDTEWLHPNTPLLASQVFLSVAVGLVFLFALRRLLPRAPGGVRWPVPFWLDLLFALGLWAAAFLIWNAAPFSPSFYNTIPVPPNFEYYPYSDSADYDRVAQYMLLGQGLGGRALVIRPLYSFSLALFRMLAGQSYSASIMIQVGLLALYPLVLYFLGRQLHSRLAGILAALLVILRERNAIALGGSISGAHSHLKLFMTDVPSAAGVAALVLLGVLWLQAPDRRRWLAPLAGGLLAALVLIRTQSAVLLVAVVLAALVLLFRRPRVWLGGLALFAAGCAAFLAPWVLRNYSVSGQWLVEETPVFHLSTEVRYYTGRTDVYPLPGEARSVYDDRMRALLVDQVLSHPGEVVDFVANHFFHNELNTALLFPLRLDSFDLKDYVTGYGFWFGNPNAPLAPLEVAFLGFNLLLLGLGVGAAFGGGRREALLPLLAHLGYNASTALARRSGGRYFLPGDWVGLFFFALGLAQVIYWLVRRCGSETLQRSPLTPGGAPPLPPPDVPARRGWAWAALALGAVALLGAVMPLVELSIPPRYPQRDRTQVLEALVDRWSGSDHAADLARLQALAQDPRADALWGRGLNPRYFSAGEGLRSVEALKDQSRLTFELLGWRSGQIILPADVPPGFFPSGADVVAFGCPAQGYLDAAALVVLGQGGQPDWVYWRTPELTVCPPAAQ